MYHVSAQGVDERRMMLKCTYCYSVLLMAAKLRFLEIFHPVVTITVIDWRKTPIFLLCCCWDITVTYNTPCVYIRIIMQNACASCVCDCVRSCGVCVCIRRERRWGWRGGESRNVSAVHVTAATETERERCSADGENSTCRAASKR